jgi:hypothetical protein
MNKITSITGYQGNVFITINVNGAGSQYFRVQNKIDYHVDLFKIASSEYTGYIDKSNGDIMLSCIEIGYSPAVVDRLDKDELLYLLSKGRELEMGGKNVVNG